MEKTKLLTYPIASGNMFYSVEEERSIYLKKDSETGFILYGEIDEEGKVSDVNLAVVILEYALSCDWPLTGFEAPAQFEAFVKRIGKELLLHLYGEKEPEIHNFNQVSSVLACICKSMEAEATMQKMEKELLINFERCPIKLAAEKTGLMLEESRAHQILHSLCRYLVHAVDPSLDLKIQQRPDGKHVIRIYAGA